MTEALAGYDSWKTHDAYARVEPHNDVEDLHELSMRLQVARRRVLSALHVLDNFVPAHQRTEHATSVARLNTLLEDALSELGCLGCGQPFTGDETRVSAWVRRHGTHAYGDCHDHAVRNGDCK
jgi:hypothetical protein